MTTWFVSRHPGALHWMQAHGPAFDQHVEHLDPAQVGAGDVVIGTLPVNLAAEVCARGARYFNLSLQLSVSDRGQELSADDLQRCQAQLQEFHIQHTPRTHP